MEISRGPKINKLEDAKLSMKSQFFNKYSKYNQQDSIVFEEDNLEKDNIALVGFMIQKKMV